MDKKYYVHTIDTFTDQNVVVEVTKEVYETINKSYRKERYFLEDLKAARVQINQEKQLVNIIKSREDFFERLTQELFKEFSDTYSIEINCERRILLAEALYLLNEEDFKMIYCLFYKDLTERNYAQKNNISQSTVNYRKNQILQKLKKHLLR